MTPFTAWGRPVNLSTAALPVMPLDRILAALPGVARQVGCVLDVVQLTPQVAGTLSESAIDALAASGQPARLHANCRVLDRHVRHDLDVVSEQVAYFEALATVSRRLQADAYTLHPGYVTRCGRQELADNLARLEQTFECRVGVEGMYPSPLRPYHLSDWSGYRWLLESGVRYALDLSHIHILATQTRRCDRGLVRELLASDRLLEVHVSSNDGSADSHALMEHPEWWCDLLPSAHPGASFFCESDCRQLIQPARRLIHAGFSITRFS